VSFCTLKRASCLAAMGNASANTCTIKFDKDYYVPGEAVTGALIVQIECDVEIAEVELVLVGSERVTWPADMDKSKILNAVKHDHTLAPSTRSACWTCDGCERHSKKCPDMQRYRCSEGCDFDLCNACSHFHEVTLMLEGDKPASDQAREPIAPGSQMQLVCQVLPKHVSKQSLREGHVEFLRHSIPLNTLRGSIKAGSSNKYPFRFVLPGDIAGTRSLGNINFGLQRSYEVRTSVQVLGFFSHNFECRGSIDVVDQPQGVDLSGAQALVSPEFHNIIGMSLGRFVIAATQELPFFGRRGDELRIRMELENFTSRDVDLLELQLYQHLRLKSNDGHDFEHDCVVQEWSCKGLCSNRMERGDDARKLFLPLCQDVMPQCIGHLVECSYYLKIQTRMTRHQAEARIPICVQPLPLETLQPALPAPSAPPAIELLIVDPQVQARQAFALAPAAP